MDTRSSHTMQIREKKGKTNYHFRRIYCAEKDFKILTKELKTLLSVGGTFKNEVIIIQGDYRDKIMKYLQDKGFTTKRVGG